MHERVARGAPQRYRHLRKRCQQRGVRKRELETLLDVADHLVPVGAGRMSVTLSRKAVVAQRAEGIAVADLERAAKRAVVIDPDGTPITVLVPSGRRGRCYRRGPGARRKLRQSRRPARWAM